MIVSQFVVLTSVGPSNHILLGGSRLEGTFLRVVCPIEKHCKA